MEVQPPRHSTNTGKRKFRLILYFLIFLTCVPLTFAEPPKSSDSVEKKFPATLDSISDSTVEDALNSPEYVIIKPSDQATFSSESTASIDNITLKEGDKFEKGEILLTFNCKVQEADLKKAKAQQTEARVALASAKKLQHYGSISEFEVVKATSDFEMADADVDRLTAIVSKCTIKAPYNGAIAEIVVHNHETVKPGDPLLKIVNTENLIFEIQVPSCWLQELRVDNQFQVHINETNQIFESKITDINPQVEPVSQTVKMIATIVGTHPDLLPGMSGQAIFPKKYQCSHGKVKHGE